MTKSSAVQVSDFLLGFLPDLLPKPLDTVTNSVVATLHDQIDSWISSGPRLQREMLDAAQKAESSFRSEAKIRLTNDDLAQAIASFPIFDNESFRKTLVTLPDHLNEDFLEQDL